MSRLAIPDASGGPTVAIGVGEAETAPGVVVDLEHCSITITWEDVHLIDVLDVELDSFEGARLGVDISLP